MERGALATIVDKDGCTVLHKACERSHIEMVKLLVSYGASIDDKNKEGKIPMDCCDANPSPWPSWRCLRPDQSTVRGSKTVL